MMTGDARHILVATDLSARDDRAVDRALALGRSWDARVHVVHVTRPAFGTVAEDVRAVLPDPGADVEIVLPVGSAPETIVRTAAAIDAAIIVTGVARFNHVGDYFLGTAVDHVIRHAPAPVLIVRQRTHGPYRRILAATDLSAPSRAALLSAAALFPGVELHVVRAFRIPYRGWIRRRRAATCAPWRRRKRSASSPTCPPPYAIMRGSSWRKAARTR
ncbi:MAG: universal stress protein [Sphingobium sp.]